MDCEILVLGPLETNTLVLWNGRQEALIVDPADAEAVLRFVAARRLAPRAVLLTHAHFDHVQGVPGFVAVHPVPVVLHPADVVVLRSPVNALPPLIPPLAAPPATVAALPEAVAGLEFVILATPGHTPGGVAYHFPAARLVLAGDTLFRESVGRHDFPGGNRACLQRSIRDVLFRLDEATDVYPGHGPPTTIGHEKRHNPWVGRPADQD